MEFQFQVIGTKLKVIKGNTTIPEGNVNVYDLNFTFSEEWENVSKFIAIKINEVSYNPVEIIENKFTLNSTILGKLSIGVFSSNLDLENLQRISTNWIDIKIGQGAYTSLNVPEPDIWETYLNEIKVLKDDSKKNADFSLEQSQISKNEAEKSKQSALDSQSEANRAESEATRSKNEADRAKSEADRSATEADRSESEADLAVSTTNNKVFIHNTSSTAHQDIRTAVSLKADNSVVTAINQRLTVAENGVKTLDGLNKDNIKNVTYNNTNGVLTFVQQDDATITIDLPVENLLDRGYYDDTTSEIVLVLKDSSEIRIPATGLIDDYTGYVGSNIQISVSSNNVISAILKNDTINTDKFTIELRSKLNEYFAKNYLLYSAQSLTTEQQTQARTNISAVNSEYVNQQIENAKPPIMIQNEFDSGYASGTLPDGIIFVNMGEN